MCFSKINKGNVEACHRWSSPRGGFWEEICMWNLLRSISMPVEGMQERRLAKGRSWAVMQSQQSLQRIPKEILNVIWPFRVFLSLGKSARFSSLAVTNHEMQGTLGRSHGIGWGDSLQLWWFSKKATWW